MFNDVASSQKKLTDKCQGYKFISTNWKKYWLGTVIIGILFTGCLKNADRINPLDPNSEIYKNRGRIAGNVTGYYPPNIGIEDVEIKITNPYQVTMTDSEGFYQFDNIASGQYKILASKPGYATDSTIVQVSKRQSMTHNFRLDALPIFRHSSVTTFHISRWFPRPYDIYYLHCQVDADDPDGSGDIILVTINFAEINMIDTLSFLPSTGRYEKLIDIQELNISNPADIIGRSISFIAKDKPGNECHSLPIYPARIIEVTPIAISPTGLQSVNQLPRLTWRALDLMYTFSYRVEIYRTDIPVPTLVWSQGEIASTETSIVVSDSLEAGRYYWTVAIVDEFSNWSRSKESSFQIE